jgi:choice-of-anchor B domain-containing protein
MKKLLSLLSFFFFLGYASAQFNVTYVGDLEYAQDLSDIWGYVAPDGTEYALVGARDGFSIVSLADPSNPTEVAFVPGPSTTWRDIKTWDHHAYVTNETGDGLLVVDLSNLPDNFSTDDWYYWEPDIPGLGTLSTIHNLYIDEFGFCYLAGANINSGGVLYIDVATDPWNPEFVGAGPAIYSHDVYARDNKLYSSEIYQGRFAIYDVTTKTDPQLLGSQTTEANFTHNTWLSDDGNVIFTTDETGNAPIGSYGISDPANIQTLDQFRPLETLGEGVIPHNVHVFEDWLIISYYTDGCIIVDGSRPDNLIEVGNFDTYFPANTGFNGAWGAYPFLPSGLIIVSDIGNGLYVLEPNYVRACWLEGTVTDADNGQTLSGVDVFIDSGELNEETTGINGTFATGQATPGTFDVTFTKVGYIPKTVQATLVNGELTILDVELESLASYSISGQVVRKDDGMPIPNAELVIFNDLTSYQTTSDASGNFSLSSILGGDYDVFAGAWGYLHNDLSIDLSGNENVIIELEEGYQDDFFADFGWEVPPASASTGIWEWGEPVGTFLGGTGSNPELDLLNDLGNQCYVTGNDGGNAGNDDVDDGETELISPTMELLSRYNEPVLSFSAWFVNGGGNGDPNDMLQIGVSNGTTEVILHEISNSQPAWVSYTDTLSSFIEITDDMTVFFLIGDQPNSGHIVEGAVDGFLITEGDPEVVSVQGPAVQSLNFAAYPNPFTDALFVEYVASEAGSLNLEVFDLTGRRVLNLDLQDQNGRIQLPGESLESGVYFLKLQHSNGNYEVKKVVKP